MLLWGKSMLGELFDPQAELFVEDRLHPHWSQAGAIVFITMRTRDSIPREVLDRWEREKADWLLRRGYPGDVHWTKLAPKTADADRYAFAREFNRCREDFLDTCHGSCPLKDPELSKIVADSFLHFDGERYRMGDFVIMPNHAHLLVAFDSPEALKSQCESWTHYTGCKINKMVGRSGKFWQQEPFDHLVRSEEQYHYLRRYIAENPKKAKLAPNSYYCRRYTE